MQKELRTNLIYCGDCKEVLKQLPEESVDLIYLDPPFFSNKHYEVIWGDGAELRAFEDRWKGGIMNYIEWMKERIEQCYRVLKRTGSLYLHCDTHASHYLKVYVLDPLFGYNQMVNEIVWCYTIGGKSKQSFGRKHDTIFLYAKSDNYTFNGKAVSIERPQTHMKMRIDKNGRPYQEKKDAKTGKIYRYFMDEGKIPEDYWTDIETINWEAAERLGYPTQKPEALLERIVKASSNGGNLVLDPFCGCGTTLVVAQRLKRKWIGIDVSPTACKLMMARLKKQGARVEIVGMPTTVEDLKKLPPFEFQNFVVAYLLLGRVSPRKSSDMGIDGYNIEGTPIQVKQSDDVGRNVIDNFETAIKRVNKKKGIVIAFSFGKGAYEEVARAKLKEELDIRLITLKELLKEKEIRLPDKKDQKEITHFTKQQVF